MAFISRQRQVGKTTTARRLAGHYLDWDKPTHQRLIATGPEAVAAKLGLDELSARPPVLAFDELHKFGRWKNWHKEFLPIHRDQWLALVQARQDRRLIEERHAREPVLPEMTAAVVLAVGPPRDLLLHQPKQQNWRRQARTLLA